MGDAGYRALQLDRVGDVLRVVIAHPTSDLNAVDGLLHEELTRLFRELKREDTARAVLLTGRGRAFSAGGDFRWLVSHSSSTRARPAGLRARTSTTRCCSGRGASDTAWRWSDTPC